MRSKLPLKDSKTLDGGLSKNNVDRVEVVTEREDVMRLEVGEGGISSTSEEYIDLESIAGKDLRPYQRDIEFAEGLPSLDGEEEREWGDSESGVSLNWYFIGGAVILIFVATLIWNFAQEKSPETYVASRLGLAEIDKEGGGFDIEPEKEIDPRQWFNDNSAYIIDEGLRLLSLFLSEESDEARSKFVRNPEFYMANSSFVNESIQPRIESKDKKSWTIHQAGDIGYLRLICKNNDFERLSIYFTRDGEGLKIDTAASSVWSEVSLYDQCQDLALGESGLLRCLVRRKEEIYIGGYNDEEHAFYLLTSADQQYVMWGYVVRGSEVDVQLRQWLGHKGDGLSVRKDIKVLIRVGRGKEGALPKQVDIQEFIHAEWVTP